METRKENWLRELREFIVEANGQTWAAGKGEVKPIFPGMKSLYYRREDWELRDNYSGYFKAPGMTLVSFKETPVWNMRYGGRGQLTAHYEIVKPTFEFLKKALMHVNPSMPFRGPEFFDDGEWTYRLDLSKKSIEEFEGYEEIFRGDEKFFHQDISGEIIIGKDKNRQPVFPWDL